MEITIKIKLKGKVIELTLDELEKLKKEIDKIDNIKKEKPNIPKVPYIPKPDKKKPVWPNPYEPWDKPYPWVKKDYHLGV